MTIRPAVTADVPAMARIRALTWGDEGYWKARIAGYLAGEVNPQGAREPRVGFVAVENQAIVGLVAGHLTQRLGCDGEMEWIDVIPTRRGSGVAKELLARLAGWFAEHDAARVCVDVEPSNHRARRFYERHGARPVNEHWLVWEDLPSAMA
jgi:ribosomal protein S18 acetylase RimI-like enzyme